MGNTAHNVHCRRDLLTTASSSSSALSPSPSARSFVLVEATHPAVHDEPAWWQCLHACPPTAPRLDATTHEVAPRTAALQTEARRHCPPHAVQLLAELRDAMACWLVVCVGAQVALMWYLASGLLSRNTAGVCAIETN